MTSGQRLATAVRPPATPHTAVPITSVISALEPEKSDTSAATVPTPGRVTQPSVASWR